MLWPQQGFELYRQWGLYQKDFLVGLNYNLDENSLYLGILPVVFFLWGIFKKGRKHIALLIIFLIFLWLSFGTNIEPSLYRLLHSLPFYRFMRVAQRYRFYFMIPLIVFIGFGFDDLVKKLIQALNNSAVKKVIATIFILFTVGDMLRVNNQLIKESFTISEPIVDKTDKFIQRCGILNYDNTGFIDQPKLISSFSDEYLYLKNGWGTTGNCYEPVKINIRSNCNTDPAYRGELYLLNNNGIINEKGRSPNNISLNAHLSADDYIIINQNYDHVWHALINKTEKKVINKNGLISMELPEGKYEVIFYYLPTTFIIGSVVSLTSIIVIFVLLLKRLN